MRLPTLISRDAVAMLIPKEDSVLDLAASVLDQGTCGCATTDFLIRTHYDAITLANELLAEHEMASPPQPELHHASRQLKFWHMLKLAAILDL